MLEPFQTPCQKIEDYLQEYFKEPSALTPHRSHPLVRALYTWKRPYAMACNGGKRFRPLLSLLVAKALGQPEEKVLPMGIAVELVHSYSLIHDDLPTMDNDDMRRGQPTNHKVYGETTALLAGDALQSEAFLHISQAYRSQPEIATELIWLLSEATGVRGMVGGQAMDLEMEKRDAFQNPPLLNLFINCIG